MPPYTVYGLRLDSDLPIGGLLAAPPDSGPSDLEVRFGSLPLDELTARSQWYESTGRMPTGEPVLRIDRLATTGELWVRYVDGTQFLISATADSVHASWPDELTVDDAIVYLLGPVLGTVLRLRGRPSLHGSVVAVGEQALAFLGSAGAGKSTIAATFAAAGHRVLSDDLLVVQQDQHHFWAQPGYSLLRLWPASVEGLYGSPDALPPLVRGWDKRYMDLAGRGAFCEEPVELGAIYVIGDRDNECREARITPIPHGPAVLKLVANSYTGRMPGRSERRAEFELCSRLAAELPVRQLIAGDWASLSRLPTMVVEDFEQIRRARAVG